jgi:hypothetical protein
VCESDVGACMGEIYVRVRVWFACMSESDSCATVSYACVRL